MTHYVEAVPWGACLLSLLGEASPFVENGTFGRVTHYAYAVPWEGWPITLRWYHGDAYYTHNRGGTLGRLTPLFNKAFYCWSLGRLSRLLNNFAVGLWGISLSFLIERGVDFWACMGRLTSLFEQLGVAENHNSSPGLRRRRKRVASNTSACFPFKYAWKEKEEYLFHFTPSSAPLFLQKNSWWTLEKKDLSPFFLLSHSWDAEVSF